MALKSRLNTIERNLKPKGKDPVEEWKAHIKRLEESEALFDPIIEGNLEACIREIQLIHEGEKWRNKVKEYLDTIPIYRNVIRDVEARELGIEPDYETEDFLDYHYYNLTATYEYLERLKVDPEAEKPKLKVWKDPGE